MQEIFPNAERDIKLQTSPMTPNVSGDIPRYKDTKKNLLGRERYQETLNVGDSQFLLGG